LAVVEESVGEEGADALEGLDDFSDFSDFNEPEMMLQDSPPTAAMEEVDESEQATAEADEIDDFSAIEGLGDDFNASDMIQDDEAEADSIVPEEEQLAVVEESVGEEDVDALEELEMVLQDASPTPVIEEVGESGQVTVEEEEVDDFTGIEGFGDDFDVSDMAQHDEFDVSDSAETELIAADEHLQEADEEPLNDLLDDENSIDSLLMEAGFDVEDASEQAEAAKDEFGDDDTGLDEIDEFTQLDEISDDFSKQLAEAEALSAQDDDKQDDDFLLPDFDITAGTETPETDNDEIINENEFLDDELVDDPFGDNDFSIEDKVDSAPKNEAVAESNPKQVAVASTTVESVGSDQGVIKKQLEEAEKKIKKTKLFSYVAMGFGVAAISAAIGLGMMAYSSKNEVLRLTEVVSTLEASLAKNAENKPNEEINAMRNSVVQLNQQVDGFITELKGIPQFPVDLLNNKVPEIVLKQDMVSKALDILQVKIMSGEGTVASLPAVAEPPKVEVAHEHIPAAKEEDMHEIAPVKIGGEHEHPPAPAKEEVAHEEPTPPKEAVAHEIAPPKVEIKQEPSSDKKAADALAPTKERAIHETIAPAKVQAEAPAKVKAQAEVVAKPKLKAVVKEAPVKIKAPAAPGKWGVNLGAFKHEWFAKSKADEYARQGVFAEVVPVPGKSSAMYRLRVGGFKSKAEANSNTAKIKKALSLDSVWVSDN
jgi:cell division septation protein DedD